MCGVIVAGFLFINLAACSPRKNTEESLMNPNRSSTADTLPRKVIVATVMLNFHGPVEARLETAKKMIDQAVVETAKKYPGQRLDLVVLPEHAIQSALRTSSAKEKSVPLEGAVFDTFSAKAKQHNTYLILPMLRVEGDRFTNIAVLFDRQGKQVGIYSKVHPVSIPDGSLEGGVTPGDHFPVFTCDFGKLGVQICWDMSYEDGFESLAKQGAEIVAIPSASPQTVRPASHALRGKYYVVTSTPRDNVTIFNPAGMVVSQMETSGVLVQQIDLSYAVLHWSPNLRNGQSLTEKYGDKVGYNYSEREDTGVFWSNDPAMSIGAMVKDLKLPQIDEHIEQDREAQNAARGGEVKSQKP